MDNAAIIARLRSLGPLPNDSTPAIDDFPLQEFDELLQQLSEPLEAAHALELINLGPPNNASACAVEWALVHAAELASAEELRAVLPLADDTEVKHMMEIRLANYFKKNAE